MTDNYIVCRAFFNSLSIYDTNISKTVNSETFATILLSNNSIKRHICHVKKSRLGHNLPVLVKDRVILQFREGFIFKISRK